MEKLESISRLFESLISHCDFWSLRLSSQTHQNLQVRSGVVQPPELKLSLGAHISILDSGGAGYAATSDLSRVGLTNAIRHAKDWCKRSSRYNLLRPEDVARPTVSGEYLSAVDTQWDTTSLSEKINLLQDINQKLNINDAIVDYLSELSHRDTDMLFVTSDGIRISQRFRYITPGYIAVANKGSQTQMRSGGGWGTIRQGGLEQLADFSFTQNAQQCAEEALALLDAPECPTDSRTLLLMPSQMMLQIHESIGHPLELDRILGDERNYAGTSFVTPEMFGQYQYGSRLLNVTSNDMIEKEAASFHFDDDGCPSKKEFVIKDGILQRPLGGLSSQARTGMSGVANARASDWNRPAIDRMTNLNVEPGDQSFSQLVAGIENGVLMDTNKSWSIDDSRNKFQFGCEIGRIIKDGEIKHVCRNPNYRGISASFWRNLSAVGDRSTFEVWGTPHCGKGEPNQMVHVGHASPACVFDQVEVFGGV